MQFLHPTPPKSTVPAPGAVVRLICTGMLSAGRALVVPVIATGKLVLANISYNYMFQKQICRTINACTVTKMSSQFQR